MYSDFITRWSLIGVLLKKWGDGSVFLMLDMYYCV
jgi:hypothetical protein